MAYYPLDFTEEDIMDFDYDFGKWSDMIDGVGQYWMENAELQIVADLLRDDAYDI